MFVLLLLLTEEASSKQHICFAAPLQRGSGLQGMLLGETLVKGRSRVSWAQFCSVCMALTGFGSSDLPDSSYFALCHRAELEREPPSLPPAEFGLCDVWCPIGIYKVTPEGTRYWLNFLAFFVFSKWELTGLSLFPNRAATQLGFSVGWPCWCCGVCWSCIFQLTFYGPAQGGDKLMWTKCVLAQWYLLLLSGNPDNSTFGSRERRE